ncbi:MAG: hypothetical protein IK123_06450, partial [Lachnospiraceae bacterium]|nr:hypothetical protein [Lachnospiraceae bacterium]
YKYGVKKPSSYIEAPTQLYVNTGNSTTPAREIGNAAGDVLYESAIIRLTDETAGARIFYATSSNVKDGDDNWHFDPDKWKYYTDGIKVANIPAADKEDLNNGTYKVTVYAYATMADHSDSGVYTKTYIVIKDDSDRGGIVSDSDWAEYLALGRPDSVWVAGVDPDGYIYTGAGITFVSGVDDGNAATHNIRVYDGKKLLTLSKDYTLSYRNNINAYTLIQGDTGFNVSKAPSIVITCRGNFSGSHTKTFKINPQDLSSANTTVVTPVITLVERKNNRGVSQIQKPGNTIRYLLPTNKTVTLRAGSDYILEYANAAADGDFAKARDLAYTVNVHGAYDPVKGVGNYKGDNSYDVYIIASLTYTVTGNVYDSHDANYEIAPKTISVKSGRLELTGIKASDEAEALAILTDEKTKETAEQKDYVYYLENNKNIGTARITFIGNEDKGYAGKVTKTYAITGTNFTKASFNSGLAASYQYTGTDIKPLIPERIEAVDENPAIEASVRYQKSRTEIVSLKGIEENAYALLTDENEKRSYDYTYRYEGDTVNIGTVKIVMTGINGYTGSVTRNYKITGITISAANITVKSVADKYYS